MNVFDSEDNPRYLTAEQMTTDKPAWYGNLSRNMYQIINENC